MEAIEILFKTNKLKLDRQLIFWHAKRKIGDASFSDNENVKNIIYHLRVIKYYTLVII